MTLVAGIDSSTQSCKVVVRDTETGEVVRSGRASHPEGTEVDPARCEAHLSWRSLFATQAVSLYARRKYCIPGAAAGGIRILPELRT